MEASRPFLGSRFAHACVRAAELRSAIGGQGGRLAALLSGRNGTRSPIALLNVRRHSDAGRPMLAADEAHGLRAAAIHPSPLVRKYALAFLEEQRLKPGGFAAIQLRSNHLAHSTYERDKLLCSQRVAACARRLSRTVRRLSPRARVIVASDIPTLLRPNQDGASHKRKGYMRDCLLPSLPTLRRWFYTSAGVSFNCSCDTVRMSTPTNVEVSDGTNVSAALCDAGFLALVDLVLTSEASRFVAVDVKTPWRSAFVEWIVQRRSSVGRKSDLISC
jgi:hypothetical protein